jgi:hypothetical protein
LTSTPVPIARRERWALVAALGLAGILVTATAVPAAFTIDESNYLASVVALRAGRVTMPGTDGLPPTTELLWFDPVDRWRRVESAPVAPLAPPLYAPLALPFSVLGWRGLVAINTLAFLATAALLFVWVRRLVPRREVAWIALAAFALGSPQLEYAQGVWPHELAMFLVFGAGYLAFRVREGGAVWLAAVAGLAAGLAGGVRHQDLFAAGCVGLVAVAFVSRGRRLRVALAFGAGLLVPVLASCSINWYRIGHFHPAWKGTIGYLSLGLGGTSVGLGVPESLRVFWARVVDFSTHPALSGELGKWHGYLHKEEQTGAFLVLGGAVKKAWLQSSPWLGLSLVTLVVAWFRSAKRGPGDASRQTELRAIALVIVPVLALFALAGFGRLDGLCYSQRYFQELVPFGALALALALGDLAPDGRALALGAIGGLGLSALAFVVNADNLAGLDLAMKMPLGLAAATMLSWPLRSRPRMGSLLGGFLAACVSWGLGAHVFDDVRAVNGIRGRHLGQMEELAAVLPQRAGLLVWLNPKIGLGPLILDHDLVIADPSADEGLATPAVVHAWLAQGRPAFLVANRFPAALLDGLRRDFAFRPTAKPPGGTLDVFELSEPAPLAMGEGR